MLFWDTSALVPVLVDEPRSAECREVLDREPDALVWWTTPVQCLSALARREREGRFSRAEADRARDVLAALRDSWHEVLPAEEVRERAASLLLRHPLRAADALGLGAALSWSGGRAGFGLCTLDDRFAEAARQEGFELVLLEASA